MIRTGSRYLAAIFVAAIYFGVVSVDWSDAAKPSKTPAQRVVVALSGGDYETVNEALAAITPTESTPYVIEVLPGTYIGSVTLKSYVHLKGSGREVTTIQGTSTFGPVVSIVGLVNVAISDLAITGGQTGVYVFGSAPTITRNWIYGNTGRGINNTNDASSIVTDNVVTENGTLNVIGGGNGVGIDTNNMSNPLIANNLIADNIGTGIRVFNSSPLVKGNTVTNNLGRGLFITTGGAAVVVQNEFTGNGTAPDGSIIPDLHIAGSAPHISFNVYDDITGTEGTGQYNVTSAGIPATDP